MIVLALAGELNTKKGIFSERSWHSPFTEGYDSGEMDASIVYTHMMLEAEEEF